MTAIPIASFIGAPLSGWLLPFNGHLGLMGWQVDVPARRHPRISCWASPSWRSSPTAPKKQNGSALKNANGWQKRFTKNPKQKSARHANAHSIWRTLINPFVVGLGCVYFGMTVGLYGIEVWLPTLLKSFKLGSLTIGAFSAIPYVAAVFGMILWARHSDRNSERIWHVAAACGLACAGVFAAAYSESLVLTLLFLFRRDGSGICPRARPSGRCRPSSWPAKAPPAASR